jgi:hypothetical protein
VHGACTAVLSMPIYVKSSAPMVEAFHRAQRAMGVFRIIHRTIVVKC